MHSDRDADHADLANPEIGEREVLAAMLEVDADLGARREGILLITDSRPTVIPGPGSSSAGGDHFVLADVRSS